MPPRRQTEPEPLSDPTDTDPPPVEAKPVKPPNAMREALTAQSKLDRITKRETDYLANGRARYQAERDDVYAGLSEQVRKILEAAAGES